MVTLLGVVKIEKVTLFKNSFFRRFSTFHRPPTRKNANVDIALFKKTFQQPTVEISRSKSLYYKVLLGKPCCAVFSEQST